MQDADAILVLNLERRGIPNYVGGNTLMERSKISYGTCALCGMIMGFPIIAFFFWREWWKAHHYGHAS